MHNNKNSNCIGEEYVKEIGAVLITLTSLISLNLNLSEYLKLF